MNPLDQLVKALSHLPGVGEKTATRYALFLLRDDKGRAAELAESIRTVKEKVRFCSVCQNLSLEETCSLCRNPQRDPRVVCVVQEPVDLMAIEKTGEFQGLYHVLHGTLSPLDGIGPEQIRIESLVKRLRQGKIEEAILATNPNPEGEATALYLKKILSPFRIKVTRIASGVPVGGTVEYTDAQTLSRAMGTRREF